MSPFNLWLVLAVIGTGFSRGSRVTALTCLFAVSVHVAVAFIPQARPLDLGVFAVRTVYLFGCSAMIAYLGAEITRQARTLGTMERVGAAIAEAKSEWHAVGVYAATLRSLLEAQAVEVKMDHPHRMELGQAPHPSYKLEGELRSGSYMVGHYYLLRNRPFSKREARWAALLTERFAASIRRLRMADELIRESGRLERFRVSDELHDGYLQTLTAIDLFAEAANIRLRETESRAADEFSEIREMLRTASQQARSLLAPCEDRVPGGKAAMISIFAERWPHDYSLAVDPEVHLTEGQWKVVEMLVKEGINNALRHAGATTARLRITALGSIASAALETNGRTPAPSTPFGYGLSRLQAVARMNSGEVFLEPLAWGGACLYVEFSSQPAP